MSIFSIGLSGLNTAQQALSTTSSNISNVNTEGYNRQLTLLGENVTGGGVQVNDVQRQFDEFVAGQLNEAKSASSALEAYEGQISQVDDLLADREAGLSPLIQDFFSSMEDLAGSPSDPAARQGVMGNADTLAAQFRSFDSYLNDMQSGINGRIEDAVTELNNSAEELASLNKEITLARAKNGEAPNGLLNQRDQLISDISEIADVDVVKQDGDTYNLTIGNGKSLVSGDRVNKLETMSSSADPERTVVGYRDSGGNLQELDSETFEEGELGGLLRFRNESLDKVQNQIGQLAINIAAEFNDQQRQGVDLNGERGADMFSMAAPKAIANDNNTSDAGIEASFTDTRQLTTGDYEIQYDGDDYSVTRLDTGKDVAFEEDGNDLTFDGVQVSLDQEPDAGDRFQVQPTRDAAGGIENLINEGADIAAGQLLAVEPGAGNQGELAVDEIRTEAGYNLPDDPLEMTVSDTDGDSFTLENASDPGNDALGTDVLVNGEAVADTTSVELESGDTLTIDGVSMTLDGMPEVDDSLVMGQAASGSGDNRNALAMQNLQDEDVVGNQASFSEAYASMVSDVGNDTNIAQVNLDAQEGLTEQLREVQQSESGVNLDEEAANLVRYQQFYQANAKVIETGTTLMDTILGLR
ncbi:flagellar hook-associated protein FlgK [Aidingimonas halophila]|uniref:Flagellar hook-associated protein 1 n=1 Tax=Aidingimonas halophila TaxID=574349 RepID=A0A1H3B8H7_9GAMM|nr:flagellar hook-associated protein FlgK [Aidingimonas halophila]GHC26094.1 flagellar hook-associated protein FlgK [Aidingimonas halophila]SDX38262.1 flagellar hook-associated protein 1 FlgK [Aidingimonas halophila]